MPQQLRETDTTILHAVVALGQYADNAEKRGNATLAPASADLVLIMSSSKQQSDFKPCVAACDERESHRSPIKMRLFVAIVINIHDQI